ncbi:nicotinate-nucleotide--dimethylbenzimidazole phosphoribosyltransferase, partial [uncultured Eubacterium sp.]|uniref:nicotinate-nucleotide--dimethylbenzimidazole phosphoribosyltransferase n=1 Tax=uncultured Eubacterium sp. TaxID=165185 RepID=UPI00280538B0
IHHVPIVLDGVMSFAAALVAERMYPGVKAYLLPSHKGKEPAFESLMEELDLHPVIDARLALGEGTGAVMLFALLDMALCVYEEKTTFHDIEIQP